MAYKESDKLTDVDTLIGHVKKLGGYIEESEDNKLVKLTTGYAAVLYKGTENLGAFLIFDKVRICIRPYYYDEFEDGAIGTRKQHGVPLAFETLTVEQRVEQFNIKAVEFYKAGTGKGLKLPPAFEIKDLKPFKLKPV